MYRPPSAYKTVRFPTLQFPPMFSAASLVSFQSTPSKASWKCLPFLWHILAFHKQMCVYRASLQNSSPMSSMKSSVWLSTNPSSQTNSRSLESESQGYELRVFFFFVTSSPKNSFSHLVPKSLHRLTHVLTHFLTGGKFQLLLQDPT